MNAVKSRRAILTGAAAAIITAPAFASSPADDPLYPVWREWRTLFEQYWAATDRLADMEDSIPAWARHPRVLVIVGKDFHGNLNGNLYYADSPEGIRDLLGFNNTAFEMNAQRIARAEALDAELEKTKQAAEAEYARCGYEAERKRRDAIWHAMVPLWKRIEESASTSPIAIAAKLDMAYASIEDVTQDLGEPPISYMGYVLRSLWESLPADMQDALRPAAEHDGQVHSLYDGRAQS